MSVTFIIAVNSFLFNMYVILLSEIQGEVCIKTKNTFIPNGMRCVKSPRFHPNCRDFSAALVGYNGPGRTQFAVSAGMVVSHWCNRFFSPAKSSLKIKNQGTYPCHRFNMDILTLQNIFVNIFNYTTY